MRRTIWLLVAVMYCVIPGCGSSGPFDYVPVSGKVTYEDGSPLPEGGGRLVFVAIDAPVVGNAHPRPAMANVNAQGEFDSVTSYKYGDGLIPGKHKVALLSATDRAGNAIVPKAYTDTTTTPLIVDTADAPLEIKVPKP